MPLMPIKPALVSGVIVLAFTWHVGYHTVTLSNQRELSKLQRQLKEQQQTQALRVQVAGSLEEAEQLRKRLPPEPGTEWLLHEVGKLAEGAGVQLPSISPQDPKSLQGVTYLSVNLQLATSYHQLGKFISNLERSPTFLSIDELEVTRVRQGTAQVRMTVGTWYVPPSDVTLSTPAKTGQAKMGHAKTGQAGLPTKGTAKASSRSRPR